MKIHIELFDGSGGSGKTTAVKTLTDLLAKDGIHTVNLKFPVGTDERLYTPEQIKAVKDKLKSDSDQFPITTALNMLNEQIEEISKTIKIYKNAGTPSLCILIDRAWISTMVYQLGATDMAAVFLKAIIEEGLMKSYLEVNAPFNFPGQTVINMPPPVLMARKYARIGSDISEHEKSKLERQTTATWNDFEKITEKLWKYTEHHVHLINDDLSLKLHLLNLAKKIKESLHG